MCDGCCVGDWNSPGKYAVKVLFNVWQNPLIPTSESDICIL